MSVCLTQKQARFYKYISEFKSKNGFYPEISLAARELGIKPAGVINYYGGLFLRGVFSDGKPQTRFHANAHVRVEQKAKAAKKVVTKKTSVKKVDKQKIAVALFKLLAGEDATSDILKLNNQEDSKMFELFRQLSG